MSALCLACLHTLFYSFHGIFFFFFRLYSQTKGKINMYLWKNNMVILDKSHFVHLCVCVSVPFPLCLTTQMVKSKNQWARKISGKTTCHAKVMIMLTNVCCRQRWRRLFGDVVWFFVLAALTTLLLTKSNTLKEEKGIGENNKCHFALNAKRKKRRRKLHTQHTQYTLFMITLMVSI